MTRRDDETNGRAVRLVRVFLSSPADVGEERALARQLIESELPKTPALRGRLALDVIAWDDPAARIPMLATETPQQSVSAARPRPATCDIVIVILWSRMGTPLPDSLRKPDGERYLSGTEWEYEDAVNSPRMPPPQVLVYRRTEKPKFYVDDPKFIEQRAQFQQVQAFLAQFRNPDGSLKGGVNEYETPSEFKVRLRQHLEELLYRIQLDRDVYKIPSATFTFRLYLSSLNDVAEERAFVRRASERLTNDPALRGRAAFEIVSLDDQEISTSSIINLTPQEAINRGIIRPQDCDLFIIILWSRMGSPLPEEYRKPDGSRYLSSLEWEYEAAYTASPRPDIVVYSCSQQVLIDLDDPELEEKLRQRQLLLQFLERVRVSGDSSPRISTYLSLSDFEGQFEDFLRSWVVRRLKEADGIRRTAVQAVRSDVEPGSRRSVFISYSHADTVWLERLKIHLKPLEKEHGVDYWDDTRIRPGFDWRKEIRSAISKARVAILLISADFLASDFILTNELPPLLLASEQEGAVILPVIVSPSRFTRLQWLAKFQSVNAPTEPLIDMPRAKSEALLVRLTDAIEKALEL